jgi:hypothetical protein
VAGNIYNIAYIPGPRVITSEPYNIVLGVCAGGKGRKLVKPVVLVQKNQALSWQPTFSSTAYFCFIPKSISANNIIKRNTCA